jgi:hypothetical protein
LIGDVSLCSFFEFQGTYDYKKGRNRGYMVSSALFFASAIAFATAAIISTFLSSGALLHWSGCVAVVLPRVKQTTRRHR